MRAIGLLGFMIFGPIIMLGSLGPWILPGLLGTTTKITALLKGQAGLPLLKLREVGILLLARKELILGQCIVQVAKLI